MCGIVGAAGLLSSEIFVSMVQQLAHRGPDNFSCLSLDNIHLGHVRLSIIDLSPQSNQPLWDVNRKACIVFNGEIYNYKTLRQELSDLGYVFASEGDAEVIINLYLHYGSACLAKLNGIFSFALWDTQQEELFVVRDPFGVKPLYYTENSDGFYFASELKSLLLIPSVSRELNYDAIFRTVVFLWSPGPDTVLKNIFKLEPGYYLIVKDHKIIQKTQYFEWPRYNPQKMSIKQTCQQIQTVLYESIETQLVSDVPVGAFLSGGLDSSLIVTMIKKIRGKPLECFTIKSMENEGNNEGFVDDLPYAKKVAQLIGAHLNIVETKPDILKLLLQMIYHLDEPQADPAPLNVFLICKQACQRGIKVLFSGAGGDDIFTGYRRHRAVSLERYWSYLPKFFRKILSFLGRKLPKKYPLLRRTAKSLAYADYAENNRLLSYFYWIDPAIVFNLFTEEVQAKLSDDPMASILTELRNRPEQNNLEKMLYLERRYFLVDHNFNYTDKMSMAHGVEVRVPFLDRRIVELASHINVRLKQKGKHGKWILKKMSEKYLPKSIIYRPKTGFGAPLRSWLKGDLKPLVDDLLGEISLSQRALFQPDKIRSMIEQDRNGDVDYTYPIFALLCIELWCRIFMDGDFSVDVV